MEKIRSVPGTAAQGDRQSTWGRRLIVGVAGVAAAAAMSLGVAPSASAATPVGGVDMQRACSTQYPSSWGLKATYGNRWDAYSWRCSSPWGYRGGIDVNRACVDQYGSGAWSGLRSRWDAFSWYCQR